MYLFKLSSKMYMDLHSHSESWSAQWGVMKRFGAYQRGFFFERGSTLKTSITAPPIYPVIRAWARSCSSTVVPLPVFMKIAVFFILEKVLLSLKKSLVLTILGSEPTT